MQARVAASSRCIFIHRLLMEHFASLYDDEGKITP
jgi:hypothetical protein